MESPSSPDSDLIIIKQEDDDQYDTFQNNLINQLTKSGSAGVAAAAAIISSRETSRHVYQFETNPVTRKRQQTRLLRKMKELVDEFSGRCGQQICIICCAPTKPSKSTYKVFGTKPLENVLKNQKSSILIELDRLLETKTFVSEERENQTNKYDLPPLTVDGIPTTLDKMTQCQLRMFIPLLLKYSTGRGKPGWNRLECKPVWWPEDLPWANIRVDPRNEEAKKKTAWTDVLKKVIKNCYEYHGRSDLLHRFNIVETINLNKSSHATLIPLVKKSQTLKSVKQKMAKAKNILQTKVNNENKQQLTLQHINRHNQMNDSNENNNCGNDRDTSSDTSSFNVLQQLTNIDSNGLIQVDLSSNLSDVVNNVNNHILHHDSSYMDHTPSVSENELSAIKLQLDVKSTQAQLDKANVFDTATNQLTSLNDLDGSPILIHTDSDPMPNLSQRNTSIIRMTVSQYQNLWNN